MDTKRGVVPVIRTILVTLMAANAARYAGAKPDEEKQPEAIRLPGHIILGGLFPMHEKGTQGRICGAVKEEKGIQRAEAMLYAIDRINNDSGILPKVTLGVYILDTCLRDTYALEQSLAFIRAHMSSLNAEEFQHCTPKPRYGKNHPIKPVAGVIGAAASPVSVMVANILRLFKVR